MTTWKTLPLVLLPLLLCHCIVEDYADAPPVNSQISSQPGTAEGPMIVECEGPESEVALLGTLCGVSSENTGWSTTDASGSGMATAVGNDGAPMLIIVNEMERTPDNSENVAAEVQHAAYVVLDSNPSPDSSVDRLNQWHRGDAVESGAVVSEMVQFNTCSGNWTASASFAWRNTEIKVRWDSIAGC